MRRLKQFIKINLPRLWKAITLPYDWFIEEKRKHSVSLFISQCKTIQGLADPFFVIGVSGGLHLVEMCLRYVPQDINVVFIANGLDNWEKRWVKKHISVPAINLNSTLGHGTVINLLLDNIQKPFGILDYDCFVFNPDLFFQAKILANDTLCNALFVYHNPVLGIDIPETFFLFLNTTLLTTIRSKYQISSNWTTFEQMSEKVSSQLNKIGIDANHYPEDYKSMYEALRLIFSLGLSEGYRVNDIQKISSNPKQVLHVGGTSWPNRYSIDNLWQLRGSYFWRRALEKHPDDSLKNHYRKKFGKLTSEEILNISPIARGLIGESAIVLMDNIISGHL